MNKKQRFFVWLLPPVWTACSLINFYQFPGRGHPIWAYTSFAGWWAAFICEWFHLSQELIPIVIALAGAVTVAGCGWLLDILNAGKKLSCFIGLCFIGVVIAFPIISMLAPVEDYMLRGCLLLAVNTCIHALIVISLLMAFLGWLIRLVKGGKNSGSGVTGDSEQTRPA